MNDFLKKSYFLTPLGAMIAIGDEYYVYLLQFADYKKLDKAIKRLEKSQHAEIIDGTTAPLIFLEQELKSYFDGTLRTFKTPFTLVGTQFQKSTWQTLTTVPYGKTQSYTDLAHAIYKPSAFRAVANANGANVLCIIIPCHRIINNNGKLGGYGGGIHRKQWLIELEKRSLQKLSLRF